MTYFHDDQAGRSEKLTPRLRCGCGVFISLDRERQVAHAQRCPVHERIRQEEIADIMSGWPS